MLPLPSAVKEAPVLQEEYIPLSFVKIYKTSRVSKQFDPLFCFFFLLNCTFDVSVCFLLEVTAVFHFPFQACEGPIDVIQRCHMNMP